GAGPFPRRAGPRPRRGARAERACLEQRHVLGAALGVLRLDVEGGIHLVDGVGHRLAVDGKAAAGGGGAEADHGLAVAHRVLRPGGVSTRPGSAPVCSPPSMTTRPLTTTRGMPTA